MSPRTTAQNEQIREQKRKLIMGAALELLAEEGYHATSIGSIAARAGVSKGLMYNYFASKEELVRAILAEGFEQMFGAIDPNHDGVLTREELVMYVNDLIDRLFGNPLYWKLYFSLTMQPKVLREFVMPIRMETQDFFQLLVRYYQRQGRANPQAEAYLFTSTIEGMAIGCLYEPNYPIKDILPLIYQRFL